MIKIHVIGGAGKLLKYFITKYNPNNIMSSANLRWSTGELYNTLGFTLIEKPIQPSYYYTDDYLTKKHKMAFRHAKLEKRLKNYDPNLTEKENMFNHGYDRIWDCGTLTFVKHL